MSKYCNQFAQFLQAEHPYWPFVLAFMLGAVAGCSRAPQVPFENLRYSAALLTAASSRNLDHVDQIAMAIDNDVAQGAVHDNERHAYDSIIAMIRAGRWKEAEAACRKFRKDQLY